MEFRSEAAKEAYREIINDVSERAIRMYAEVKNGENPVARFHLNLMVEQFQIDGRAPPERMRSTLEAHQPDNYSVPLFLP